uniref:Uncharacterized protein n=1 Tax=Knipowitschia caucasica TaxID=637954 RepID=A0AAV2MFG0_KNICA
MTTREGEKVIENNTVLQDKADEMIELNKMKKQLSELRSPLLKDAISTAAFPISPTQQASVRIRRCRAQLSAAYDDTEYEPYGLPE